MRKRKIFLLLLIFFGALFVRLYRFNGPVADWHSWRQADTAAVARNFLKFGFDPLRPRYDDLSNVQTGLDNPRGYRMVEFPVYQILGTGLYQLIKFIPGITIEMTLRLISILSSLGTMLILYRMTRKDLGFLGALGSLIIFGFLPYSIFYSRAILPEMTAVFLALGAVWIASLGRLGVLGTLRAGIFAGLAVLTKPTAVFLLLPMIYFATKDFRKNKILRSVECLGILSILIIGPFLAWRWWIGQFPEGIPANRWLLNGDSIRFSGAFFRWLLFERLIKLILGYWLILPLIIGATHIIYKKYINYIFLMSGTVLYAFIFATGNVRHDYYQVIWLPVLAVFAGAVFSLGHLKWKILLAILFILSIKSSWDNVQGYYWINNYSIIEAGKIVNKITPQNAKIIAPYGGDTAFLYQTNRQGWPVGFEIEKKIALGADYYVNTNVNDAETKYVQLKWKTILANDKYVIVDLKKDSETSSE